MKNILKKIIFKLIRLSGLPHLTRELIQKDKVTILLFHNIESKVAQKNFHSLSQIYNIINLQDFIEATKSKAKEKLPPKALIITFDDGHIGNYKILPQIKEFKIPVTIFLCAGLIDSKRHFWFKFEHPDVSISHLKKLTTQDKLKELQKAGFSLSKEFPTPQALSKKQIIEMKPFVDFQSHTIFHPILPRCTDEEAQNEIFKSKEILENQLGLKIMAISYPNGDYSDRDIELCKKSGYQCGITVDCGFNDLDTDLFKLKRLSVNDTDNPDELIVKASGVWAFFKTFNGLVQKYGHTKTLRKRKV